MTNEKKPSFLQRMFGGAKKPQRATRKPRRPSVRKAGTAKAGKGKPFKNPASAGCGKC